VFTRNAWSLGRISGVAVEYLDYPRPLAFAHRGGAGHRPENSWRAFEYAVELGYVYLETDTRSTADGKLIAFHDAELDRATDRTGQVSKLTWNEVSAARVHGTEEIPLLEDLIGTFPGLRFNIDLKDEGTIGPLASVLKRTASWDRVCVTSFSGARLLAAQRSLDQPICLAVTPAAIAAMRFLGLPGKEMARRLARSGARCAQVPRQIATRGFIRRAHAVGLDVHVWTLNTREEIERALGLGADGVMTDDIVLLRDVLAERGQWHPRVPV
jgi:glycerophosphoryl diester phosphodiesterase